MTRGQPGAFRCTRAMAQSDSDVDQPLGRRASEGRSSDRLSLAFPSPRRFACSLGAPWQPLRPPTDGLDVTREHVDEEVGAARCCRDTTPGTRNGQLWWPRPAEDLMLLERASKQAGATRLGDPYAPGRGGTGTGEDMPQFLVVCRSGFQISEAAQEISPGLGFVGVVGWFTACRCEPGSGRGQRSRA
jgi:hypothetical protein